MTESTITTPVAAPEVTVFDELLSKTMLPDAAIAPMKQKLVEAYRLISLNNQRVIQVNAAKAMDPNNLDYLDTLWNAHATDDPEIAEIEPLYQAAVEEYLKLQAKLRTLAKKHIPAVLSDDETKALKNLVNGSGDAIDKAIASARDMALVVDQMLAIHGAKPEGGIISLLPSVDSLKSTRGRKAANAAGGERTPYMTRVGDILLDGVSTNITVDGEVKAKFNFAADAWNKKYNAEQFPENGVTAVLLEEAFFKHMGIPWRSIKGAQLPEDSYEFEFTKDVKEKSKQDGTETVRPVTVKVTVVKPESKAQTAETAKPETPAAETPAAVTKETLKPGDFIRPEPAKKAVAPKAETPKGK
jgi:hypothetical protein